LVTCNLQVTRRRLSGVETDVRLANKTALITGGTSGIGLATARLFIAEGARVAITGRDAQKLDAVARELGPRGLVVQADATDRAATERAIQTVVETLGKLDVLFAIAGIAGTTPVSADSLAQFEQILKTNLTGPFMTIMAAAPYLNDGASIILTGSVHAEAGFPGYAGYAASKAGIRAMTRVLAGELSERGIRVNVVSPGPIQTPIWDSLLPTPEAYEQFVQRIGLGVPLARMGEPDEVAKTVLFLASSDSSYVQGADIAVDGGMNGTPAGAPIYRPRVAVS
jgi:NAD(P)-dependent dehydrogenase (short-subunit alcohol dehydrogenase family)